MFKKKYIMYCPVCGYVDGEHAKLYVHSLTLPTAKAGGFSVHRP